MAKNQSKQNIKKIVHFRLTDEEYNELVDKAVQQNIKISELCRILVKKSLKLDS